MRALVFADLQATDGHERCFGDPAKLLQIHRLERFFDLLKEIYERERCDALWDLGDTTDDRTAIPVPVIDLLCERLEPFTGKWNLKLVGNHEQFLRSPEINAGKMFRRFFHVVEDCEALTIEKVNILAVSYHDDERVIVDFLRRQRARGLSSGLLGHFQVIGAQLPGGLSATGVGLRELDFVNFCLLGHVHRPQTLVSGPEGQPVHYVGSPFEQNWGESGEAKRVGIIDLLPNRQTLRWVPLSGFPTYAQVGFEEFTRVVRADSEDRFKVVLRSVEETERFYAHPLADRAEPVYDFVVAAEAAPAADTGEVIHSKQSIMRRYLELNPPQNQGITVGIEQMLAFGEQISTGT
jgi:hypothetical protein